MVDQDETAAQHDGGADFKCEMTPLFLAGSPRVRAGVEGLRRMRDHLEACPRCQATESRYVIAQDAFLAARGREAPDEVLDAVLEIFSIQQDRADAELGEVESAAHQAGRAGDIATDRFDTLLEKAEQEAETIRRDALQDAEDIRREAVTAAERLMGRIQALEFPLGQLVADLRDETQRVTREIQSKPYHDSHATTLPPGADRSSEQARSDEQGDHWDDVDGASEPDDTEPGLPAEEEQGRSAEPVVEAAVVEEPARNEGERPADNSFHAADSAYGNTTDKGKKGKFLRRRRSKRPEGAFISVEGNCAICRRTLKVGSEDELARSGWKVSEDVGLCPECQADGWQLPEGARLPFRRGGS